MKKLSFALILFCFLIGCQSKETKTNEQPAEVEYQAPVAVESVQDVERFPPAPELPPAPDTLKIAVISDINSSYGTIGYSPLVRTAVKHIVENHYDFVVSPGDLVAGQKQGLDYARMWQAFHYEIDDVFFDNNLEFIFAPGNHDASAYSQHAIEREAFQNAFRNRFPRHELFEGSRFPFYYGVMIRGVRVIALDITKQIRDDDAQLDWLEKVLSFPADDIRLTLVLGHMPLSPVNLAQFWEVANSPRLLSMLQKTPNTIYISGHHHIYYPGHIGELRTIASPALGSGPRSLLGAPPFNGFVQITVPPQAPPRVEALVAPDFKRRVNISMLPSRLVRAEREDVGMAEYIMEMLDDDAKKVNE